MNKKIKIFLYIILTVLVVFLIMGISYVNDFYHADDSVNSYLSGNENVSVIKTCNGLFLDGKGTENAVIFYPGAKVEYTSYLPLFMNLSNEGIDCFIVEMPFNLAFLGSNSADDIINNDSNNYHNWFISGHSLGGVMASSYAHNNPDKINGLILLSAYPADDVKNIPILSIYGSNDEILNKKQYEENINNLSSNVTEYIIEGGNHAQFANYGKQSGDGVADITRDKQIIETAENIYIFINKIS